MISIDNSISIKDYDDKNNDNLMKIKANFNKDVQSMRIH